jgi:30S ribosomal protein S31
VCFPTEKSENTTLEKKPKAAAKPKVEKKEETPEAKPKADKTKKTEE